METETLENKNSNFTDLIRDQIELLNPDRGSFLSVIVNQDIDKTVEKVLEDAEFTILKALTVGDIKGQETQGMVLSSQYIARQQKPDQLRANSPFRVALIIRKDSLQEAMQDRNFYSMWVGELEYGWTIQEEE